MQQRELAQCRKVVKLDARLDDIGVRRLSSNDEDNDNEEEKEDVGQSVEPRQEL